MTDNQIIQSGVAFPGETGASVSVDATFLEAGDQLQQLFVGLEAVLVIQPEYYADTNEVKFVVTAVDLDTAGLVTVLEVILDAAKEMAQQRAEAIAEQDAIVLQRCRELQAAGPNEYPTGYYDHLARVQLDAEAAVGDDK